MFCKNCGNQVQDDAKFCSVCGTQIEVENATPVCKNCGRVLDNNEKFCPACGQAVGTSAVVNNSEASGDMSELPSWITCNPFLNYLFSYRKTLPGFIVGLIGSIFGMLGGICTIACSLSDGAALIFLGGVIALVGACLCLSKARLGTIAQFLGFVLIVGRSFTYGGDFFTVFSIAFLFASCIISAISAFFPKKKNAPRN